MKPPRAEPTLLVNRSMPPSVVIIELAYPNVREAVKWLCQAFGFIERLRISDHRAQLTFGMGAIVITGTRIDSGVSSEGETSLPSHAIAFSHSIMLRVADANHHHDQAKHAGARIVSRPTDYPYGERQYTAEDIGGHRWTFSQTIADVEPSTLGGELFE